MRLTVFLATASCVQGAWLRWSVNHDTVWAPQKTGDITESTQIGWTPIPTPAPGVRSDGRVVLDLLRRQTTKTDWTNSETCGWFSGISSSAMLCADGFTCATNSDHAVACASGTIKPFYTACLDYSAFQAGSCSNLNTATGCCQQEDEPACGTYLWTGAPARSMYRCFETASIVTILDVPQFVVDASLFSKTHTTPKPTTTTSPKTATGTDSASQPDKTGGGDNPSSETANPTINPTTNPTTNPTAGSSTSNTTNNTPAIVGGAVGGIAGLLLLLILLLCLRRKAKGKLGLGFTRNSKNKNKKEDKSSKAYHTTNLTTGDAAAKGRNSSGSETTSMIRMPPQQQPQQYFHTQEQHHYHPVAQMQPQLQPQQLNLQQHLHQQPQPQPQLAVAQQPSSMSYTVNEGANTTRVSHTSHTPQPSYSNSTSYTTMPQASSSHEAAPQIAIGGIIPISHRSGDTQQPAQPPAQQYYQQQPQQQPGQPQAQQYYQQPLQPQPGQPQLQQYYQVPAQLQPQFLQQQQPQPQQQQQAMPPQSQPVNHFHVYIAPPAQQSEQGGSNPTSQFSSPVPGAQTRGGTTPDALGLFIQQPQQQPQQQQQQQPGRTANASQDRGRGQEAARGRGSDDGDDDDDDNIPAYYGHSRDASATSSASRRDNRSPDADMDAEWLATRGPGYRQSM
ncbi:putative carcinoembryonic antigen-related cell adhesion molecule 3 [Rosellinia necatrix]|uniref:Putative carcinoembryonic antigen-related cell adhesion molecule 3 n=1 Tax=Rosellinia necatrix TaxID=77044 RepID=A0A1W2TQN0_ROSNE|nr:putative carcinoembryonic antigen-related cell adhesion molecule 3 [Rosellinia necatrix]